MNTKTQPISDSIVQEIINLDNISILELDKEEIISLFKSNGVLLFRGFDVDTNLFKEFTNLLSIDFRNYAGGAFSRRVINGDQTLLSVNDFKSEIKLHGEMYYQQNIPLMLWFFCANPPLEDGETTVCDGRQFFNEINSSTKELFSKVKEADEILVAITRFSTDVISGGYQRAESIDTSYNTDGMTALYDAIVDAQNRLINETGTGYMQQLIDNGTTTQAAILIFTDGMNNHSKSSASDAYKALVYLKKSEVPVIFVAFGNDAVTEAKTLGVADKNIIFIDTDHADTASLGAKLKEVLQIASKSVVSMSKSVGGTVDAGLFSV